MSGHRLIPTQPNTFFYGATKFAVTALTEGIRQELREMKSNVKVTVSYYAPPTIQPEEVGHDAQLHFRPWYAHHAAMR